MNEETNLEEQRSLLGEERERSSSSYEATTTMYKIDFDEVLSEVDGFGRYQKTFYFLLCLPAMFTATITLANVFVTAEPKSRCDIPICDDKYLPQYDDAFVGPHYFANYTIPMVEEEGEIKFSTCQYYKPLSNTTKSFQTPKISEFLNNVKDTEIYQCDALHFNQSIALPCTSYLYDQSMYHSTVISEWNLVCDQRWKVPLIESVFFAGVMVCAPLFGILADKFGRKPILMMSILLTCIFGIPLGLSPNYNVFLVLQFFTSVGQLGIFQTCFIMAVELVAKEKRVMCGIVIEYFFVAGEIFLAGMAYALRDWNHILLVSTCPIILFLLYWPVLPESVRWLLVNKKIGYAENEIYRISRWNRKPVDINSFKHPTVQEQPSSSNLVSVENNVVSTVDSNDNDCRSESIGAEANDNLIIFRTDRDINSRGSSNACENNTAKPPAAETFINFLGNRVLLARHVNVCYCWLVVTMVYYGLSMVSSF